MTRRGLLVAFAALPLWADNAQQVWNLLSGMATALSQGDAVGFMGAFDRSTPGYQGLQTDILALFAQYQVSSSIDVVSDMGDDQMRVVEADWFLQIVEQQETESVTRRRELVRCQLVKRKKNWRIISFAPMGFFTPPQPKH
jgi:hypothetical protein